MHYVEPHSLTTGQRQRINSSYGEAATIDLARQTLAHAHYVWADQCDVVNEDGDIVATVVRADD